MESIKIDILNPKAKDILEDLADLNLIKIRKENNSDLFDLLKRMRAKAKGKVNLDEITNEVETVRLSRYEKDETNPWHQFMD